MEAIRLKFHLNAVHPAPRDDPAALALPIERPHGV
jgi:hypothetical protein